MDATSKDEYLRQLHDIENGKGTATEKVNATMVAVVDQSLLDALDENGTIAKALRALGFVRTARFVEAQDQEK